jgi:copper transport protein
MNTTRLSVRPASGWLHSHLRAGATLGAAIGLAIALVGSLSSPTALAADNTLASSTPAAGSTLEASPTSVEITFVQPLGPTNTLTMTCGGAVVKLGNAVVLADQLTLSASLVSAAPKGECAVVWVVTDANLQPAGSGSITFSVANDPVVTIAPETTLAAPGETLPLTATTPTPTAAGNTATTGDGSSSSGPLGLFRLFSNLGLAILFGSLVLIAIAWPEGVEYILTVRFLRTTWIFTIASTYLFVGALAASQSASGIGTTLVPTGWGDLLDSTPGKAALLRLVFVAASAYVVLRPEHAIDPATQLPALLPPGVAVITMAFSRDAFSLLENATGAVHALAMSVWLGGLILLARVVLAGPGEEDLVHAVRGFARISKPALWATVVTGAIQLFQLDRGALGTSHGLVVIVKTLFVSVMLFVGVAARQFISQRAARAATMTAPLATRLRRALGIEALIGVVVLALTSWLLALAPPGLSAGSGIGSLQLGAVHRFQGTTGVEVDVAFSERVGTNDVRIEVVAPAAGVSGLVVDFIPPVTSFVNGMSINNIPLTGTGAAVLEKGDGFTLSATGIWTLIVSANGAEVARQDVFVGGGTAGDATTSTTTG